MTERIYNVLFLCTGNSARSILAESIMSRLGKGKFRGFSAGSHPKGQVHPIALALLKKLDYPTESLRSKSWDEFATPNGPHLDFVFTVCDNAAGEVCPHWPGQPMTAHWGIPDPAAVEGADVEKSLAFRAAFRSMETRIKLFLSLPIAWIDRMRLKERLDAIGAHRMPVPTMHTKALSRRLLAEGIGSALLAATVVGSGIMAERLAAVTSRLRCSRIRRDHGGVGNVDRPTRSFKRRPLQSRRIRHRGAARAAGVG